VWQQRPGVVLSPCGVDLIETPGDGATVQRRAERAEIDQKEPILRRLPADTGVLTRHLGRRGNTKVDRMSGAAASDADAVSGHVVEMMAGLIVVLDSGEKPRRRRGCRDGGRERDRGRTPPGLPVDDFASLCAEA